MKHSQGFYELERCNSMLMKFHQPEAADIISLLTIVIDHPDAVEMLALIRGAVIDALLPMPDPEESSVLKILKRYVSEKEAESGEVVPFNRDG